MDIIKTVTNTTTIVNDVVVKSTNILSKESKSDYIECSRCEKNNWDNPAFWGCPRGSCEVETKGVLITTLTLNTDEQNTSGG